MRDREKTEDQRNLPNQPKLQGQQLGLPPPPNLAAVGMISSSIMVMCVIFFLQVHGTQGGPWKPGDLASRLSSSGEDATSCKEDLAVTKGE